LAGITGDGLGAKRIVQHGSTMFGEPSGVLGQMLQARNGFAGFHAGEDDLAERGQLGRSIGGAADYAELGETSERFRADGIPESLYVAEVEERFGEFVGRRLHGGGPVSKGVGVYGSVPIAFTLAAF
jgi:hypothetical protein